MWEGLRKCKLTAELQERGPLINKPGNPIANWMGVRLSHVEFFLPSSFGVAVFFFSLCHSPSRALFIFPTMGVPDRDKRTMQSFW